MHIQELTISTGQSIHFLTGSRMPDASEISARGLVVADCDAKEIRSEQQLFAGVSQALQFPEWFGYNWDAFNDCLRDLEWLPGKGYVLILHDSKSFWTQATDVAGNLVETWLFCTEYWQERKVPFHLIFLLDS